MDYRYGVLSRDLSPEGEEKNAVLLGPQTLGIEITDPALAKRCGLGNVDPQHRATG